MCGLTSVTLVNASVAAVGSRDLLQQPAARRIGVVEDAILAELLREHLVMATDAELQRTAHDNRRAPFAPLQCGFAHPLFLAGLHYWYPTHGYQQDQPSVLLVPSRPSRFVDTRRAMTQSGFDRIDRLPVCPGAARLTNRSHINVPLQPRRLSIAPAGVGCKPMLGCYWT